MNRCRYVTEKVAPSGIAEQLLQALKDAMNLRSYAGPVKKPTVTMEVRNATSNGS